MAAQLQDIQAAIHKTAAGKMGQASPEASVRPGGAPSAVAQDLSVLADQAIQFSRGQAAGNAQAEVERNDSAAGLATERAQSDTARAEELEAQRREMQVIEQARRAAEQEAALELAADAQRVALAQADAAEQGLQARMRREADERELAEKLADDRLEKQREAEAHRMSEVDNSVYREHGEEHTDVYDYIASRARSMGEAEQVIGQLGRNGAFNRGGPLQGVNMQIIYRDLGRRYGA